MSAHRLYWIACDGRRGDLPCDQTTAEYDALTLGEARVIARGLRWARTPAGYDLCERCKKEEDGANTA